MRFSTTVGFLLLSLLLTNASEPLPVEKARLDGGFRFYELSLLELEGKGWSDTPTDYDRLPGKAQGKVPGAVWNLSRDSAGICARFVTDATELSVRWVVTSRSLAMPHMPATGVSGVDLYVRQPDGKWRWVANGRPNSQTNLARLFHGVSKQSREYCLYLPLYNGVSSVEIGVPSDTRVSTAPARTASNRKPLLFYGTSITQGGCASRPGMVHTAIIGRRLDQPVINLGFSGNGRMEPEMADLLAELDPAVYVLDCLPNMNGKMVKERVEPFVKRLREAHPGTPILLVEDRIYSNAFFFAGRANTNRDNHRELRAAFDRMKADGVKGLYYLPGERLLGADGEDTVDGSHPTDLGFARQADAFLKALSSVK